MAAPSGASTAGLVRGAKPERSEQKAILRIVLNHLAIFNGVITILLAKTVLLALAMDAILPLVLAAVLSAILARSAAANWALPRPPAHCSVQISNRRAGHPEWITVSTFRLSRY